MVRLGGEGPPNVKRTNFDYLKIWWLRGLHDYITLSFCSYIQSADYVLDGLCYLRYCGSGIHHRNEEVTSAMQ